MKDISPDSVKGRLTQFHQRFGDQVSEASELAARLETFVDETIGSAPTAAEKAVVPGPCAGRIDELNNCANGLERQFERIRSALSRLGA